MLIDCSLVSMAMSIFPLCVVTCRHAMSVLHSKSHNKKRLIYSYCVMLTWVSLQVIKVSAVPGAVSDIAISGLPAWITLLSPGKSGNVHVKVWVPKGVEVFVRPAIPIAGLDRYEPDPEWPVAM